MHIRVKNIFERNDRMYPDEKDYMIVKMENGDRVKAWKRLLLGIINKIYIYFKREHNDRGRFQTFGQLQPK